MNRNKKFLKNTIILFIGKFTSQFMSLLLIPLFTYFLTTDDYGTIDLLQTIISLFIPVLSLRIDSAVFRFLIDCRDDEEKKKVIISNSFLVVLIGIIFTALISITLELFINYNYIFESVINLIILIVVGYLMQVERGIGKNKEYSISCIIIGVFTLLLNIIFIVVLKYKAVSILWASSISNLLGIIYILFDLKFTRSFSIKSRDKKTIKELLRFSIPMIPDFLSGWVINVSDRALVSFILGMSFNGIYTVASKFSNILNSIFSIVNMSWQETAALHVNDDDREEFFSDMINNMMRIFSIIGLLMIVGLALVFDIAVGKSFRSAYVYIPILIYGNTWRVLVGTTSGIYIAFKKTKEVANTTVVSAIINAVINLAFIKVFGLYAACFSTFCAYFIMGLYRYFDCKKYINIKLDWKFIIIYSVIFLISAIVYLIKNV